jgi:Protein kinase domain
MSRIRGKIAASAAIIISILALDTSERIISSPDPQVLDSNFYMVATFLSTVICFIITYLYVNHVANRRRKVMVAAGFLSIIALILPMRFFLDPPRWDFEYRLIIGIDKLANTVFLSMTYIRDVNIKILCSVFISHVIILEIHTSDPYMQSFNAIFTSTCCIIVFISIFWLYMRVTLEGKRKIIIATAFIFLFFVIILTYIVFIWFSRWQLLFDVLYCINIPLLFLYPLYTHVYARIRDDQYNFLDLTELPTRFTFKDINEATRNFRTPIGQGAFSTVFKGTLQDGTIVAVKQIKGQPGLEDDFNNEITIIGSIQHINLVHLLGYCLTRRGEKFLVYPFFENGSLDTWLFAVEEKRRHLTWALRYQIAVDVAKALAYLHHDCRHQILHLDIKPANILLGGRFRAILSDFGISKSMSREESSMITRARGTVLLNLSSN